MKQPPYQSNSKEYNAMLSYTQQQQSHLQSPNGLSVSNHINMFTSNNKMLKGTDYQSQQLPHSFTDVNNNNPQTNKHSTLLGKYDPRKKPPLVQIAQEHSQSIMVGINKKHVSNPELLKACPCCQRQIEKTQFSLNCELSKMAFLGLGVPLYFHFIKLCMFVCFIHLSSSSIYQIVSNSKGTNCVSSVSSSATSPYDNCYQNWINYFSMGNNLNSESDLQIQSILGVVSVFLMILGIHYYRGIARKVVNEPEYDVKHTSITDYSIMVSGLQMSQVTTNFAETIKFFFENFQVHLLERMLKVESVDLCFDITLPQRLNAEKDGLEKRIRAIRSRTIIPDKVQKELDNLESQLSKVNKEIFEFEYHSQQKDLEFYQKYFLGKAFVIFSTIKEKELLLQQTQIPPDYKIWGGKGQIEFTPGGSKIEISQAPHPKEVNWENLYLKEDQYFKKTTAGLIYTTCLSIFFFLIIMIFLLVQYNFLEQGASVFSENDNQLTNAMSLSVAFIIPVLNKFLLYFIKRISKLESHPTKQVEYNQTTRNVAKSQIFITCCTTLFIQLIFSKDHYVGRIFNAGGLVNNQMLIVITQSFLLSIFSLFDLESRAVFWRRKGLEQVTNHTQINLTQSELNNMFEQPEMDFMDGYSTTLTIICQALFFSALIPFALIFGLGGLLIKYWVDKYIFVRKRSVIHQQNHHLCFLMLDLLEYVVLIYSVGNLIFTFYAQSYFIPYAALAGVALSLMNCLYPSENITQRLFNYERKEIVEVPFHIVKERFPQTYHQYNPVLSLVSSLQKTSLSNLKIKKSNREDYDDQNRSGSRSNIKKQIPQLDEYQNEIQSLSHIVNTPDQMKRKVGESSNGNVLQSQTSKQNVQQSLQQRSPSKSPAGAENNANNANKSIKSQPMITSHNIYNNQNKENINKLGFQSQKSMSGADQLKSSHLNQSHQSQQPDNRNSKQYSLSHMKSKEFERIQQKSKLGDDSFIEEPENHFSPTKNKMR